MTSPQCLLHGHPFVVLLVVASVVAVLWAPLQPSRPTLSLDDALGLFDEDVQTSQGGASVDPRKKRLVASLTEGNMQYLSLHYHRLPPPLGSTDGLLLVPSLDRIPVGPSSPILPFSTAWDLTALEIRMDHNETFVAIPVGVPSCATVRHRKHPIKHRGSLLQKYWVRIAHNGNLDINAFAVVGSELLSEVCGADNWTPFSIPALDTVNLNATFPADIECTASHIKHQRQQHPAWGLPRMAMHVALYWSSKQKLLKKSPFLRRIIDNAKQFPFHVDLYVHVNSKSESPDHAVLLEPEMIAEQLWLDQFPNATQPHADNDAADSGASSWADSGTNDPQPPMGTLDEEDNDDASVSSKRTSLSTSTTYLVNFVQRMVAREKTLRPSRNLRLFIVPHAIREAGFFFPWKARQQIQNQLSLYDLVLFSEDDMDVKPINLEYYCKFKNIARSKGHYLSFFRVEYGKRRRRNPTGKVLSDVLHTQQISRRSPRVVLNNHLFASVEIQVYHAFWFADRRDLHLLVQDERFLRKDFSMKALILEEASCLHGPLMLTRVYNSTRIFPVDPSSMLPHPMCEVHHMSNAYGDKGMARFHDAGLVSFGNG